MKMIKISVALTAFVWAASPALAQPMQMTAPKRIAAPAEPGAIPLYAGTAPGSEGAMQKEVWTDMWAQRMVRNVTWPTLTPVLPKRGKATGAAVLVIPGGGFQFVSMDNEGWPIARWLADRGVAAFILKYRLEETPDSEADFGKAMAARFTQPNRDTAPAPSVVQAGEFARADAQAALRIIRSRAGEWGVDSKRVGMLGFSAGAMATLSTTIANAPDARPDFIAPIYGMMTAVTPPPSPQPMFAAMAVDDPLFNKQGFGLIESWKQAGGSVEFHLYSGGSHGFGSRTMGTTSDLWFEQFMAWMKAKKLLEQKK